MIWTPKLKHPVDSAALVKTNEFHQKPGRLAHVLTVTLAVPTLNWSNTKKSAESQVKAPPTALVAQYPSSEVPFFLKANAV